MSAAHQEPHQGGTLNELHLTFAHLLACHLPLITHWPSAWLAPASDPHALLNHMISACQPSSPHERPSLIVSPELVPSLSSAEAKACVRVCLSHAAQRLWSAPSNPLALQRLSERLCEAYESEAEAWSDPQRLERWLSEALSELWRPEPLPPAPQEALQGALQELDEERDEELDEERDEEGLDELTSFGAALDNEPLFDAELEELEEPAELEEEPSPQRDLAPPPPLEKARKRASMPHPAPAAPSARASALPPPPAPAPAPAPAQPSASAPPIIEPPAEAELSMTGGAMPDVEEQIKEEWSEAPPTGEPSAIEPSAIEPSASEPSAIARSPSPPSRIEGWLDEESADPGPLERLIERVRLLSAALNASLGLHALPLLHLIDQLWELLSGYIKGIFGGLMTLRSAMRVSERRARGELSKGFTDDAQRALSLTGALLCLPQPTQGITHSLEGPRGEHLLALALTTRAQLDDLKRDLAQLRGGGVRRGVFSALKNYALDLIPNPLSVFKPWWTWLLVTFGVRFKRATIIDLVSTLQEELMSLVDDLKREEEGERVDHGARVSELRAQLSRLQLITLQSHHHARPSQWRPLALITELKRAEGTQLSHPLSVTQTRLYLLERLLSVSEGVAHHEQRELVLSLAETRRLHELLTALHERAEL